MHDMAELLGQLLLATQLNGSLLCSHLCSGGVEREEEEEGQVDSVLQYSLIWPWAQVSSPTTGRSSDPSMTVQTTGGGAEEGSG